MGLLVHLVLLRAAAAAQVYGEPEATPRPLLLVLRGRTVALRAAQVGRLVCPIPLEWAAAALALAQLALLETLPTQVSPARVARLAVAVTPELRRLAV